jgi:hypothetical protein
MGEVVMRAMLTAVEEGLLLRGDGVVAGCVGDRRDSKRAPESEA